jgi:hypothetical protein
MEGAGRELVRLLLTEERLEEAILAGARECFRGSRIWRFRSSGHASWIRGMASGGGGWIQGRGRQAGVAEAVGDRYAWSRRRYIHGVAGGSGVKSEE